MIRRYKMKKNIKKLTKEVREALTENILFRYDNPEYWDIDVVDYILCGLSEETKQQILSKIGL
jgi:hypothetical protein